MTHQLLQSAKQVIVITGASSGIGLVTAKRAAARGGPRRAGARNENDLRNICDEIRGAGGRATFVVADVTDPKEVERIADAAIAEFGASIRGSTTPPCRCTGPSWTWGSRTCGGRWT